MASTTQTDVQPFQSLLFLVRNWPNALYDFHYGLTDGKKFLNEILTVIRYNKTAGEQCMQADLRCNAIY